MSADLFQAVLTDTLQQSVAISNTTYKAHRHPSRLSDLQFRQALVDDEKDHYFPGGRPGISYLPSDFLRSGLFCLSTSMSDEEVTETFPIHQWDSIDVKVSGEFIHYRGPRLTQYHKRILLEIVALAAGAENDATLRIEPVPFLAAIGRNSCTRNKLALARAFEHLACAKVRVTKYAGDWGMPLELLRRVSWLKNEAHLEMAPSLARTLWWNRRTLLPLALRTPLSDGLATGLMDLFRAAPQPMYTVKALAAVWEREPVQFGRELGPVLLRLAEIGFLSKYRRSRGKIHIIEAPYKIPGR